MPESDVIRIALDESSRNLAGQANDLTALHTRASFILAAAGIAAGVIGGESTHGFGLLSLLAFLIAALLAVWVLLPRWDAWIFTNNARTLIDEHADYPERSDPDAFRRFLAQANQDNYVENSKLLERLYKLFWGSCLSAAVGIGLWALSTLLD